jgi:hypothetical protein
MSLSYEGRGRARPRALIVGVLGFLVFFAFAYGSQYLISFHPAVVSLSSAPKNSAVAAALPAGPQHFTLSYTAGPKSKPTATESISGYIDLSKVSPTSCALSATGTASSSASSQGGAGQVAFTTSQAPGQVTFTKITAASGADANYVIGTFEPQDYAAPTYPTPSMPVFLTRFSGGLCSFDQMSRYATISSSGAIKWLPAKYTVVVNNADDEFDKALVAAGSAQNKEKNAVYTGLTQAELPVSAYTSDMKPWSASLEHLGTTTVYRQATQNGQITLTFSPSPTMTVPKIDQPSFAAQSIAAAKAGATDGALPTKYIP